jgi:hypothetical protein
MFLTICSPQLPEFKLALKLQAQFRVVQLIPQTARQQNQLPSTLSISSPVRLGNLDIVLSASQYLQSSHRPFFAMTIVVCLFYIFRAAFDALQNPAEWPPSRTYNYSTSTSNTGLRGHLDKFHKEEYIKLAEERGWTTTLPSIKRELALKMVTPAKTPKPMFSVEAVTQRLVRFIAANDQVSFSHGVTFL